MPARTRPNLTYVSPGVYLNEDGYYVDRNASLIYFIRERGGARRVKIGYTTNLRARFAQICTGSSEELEVIHTEPGGKPREKHLHRLWKRFHHHLEWHNPGDPILDYVKNAPPGRRGRDPFSLPAIPWRKALRPLGVTPRGAVRLLLGLLQLVLVVLSAGKAGRMGRRAKRSASLAVTTGAGAGATHFHYGPAAWWGIIPAVVAACYFAGRGR